MNPGVKFWKSAVVYGMELITRRVERKENEDTRALRGVCLRSFPEILADVDDSISRTIIGGKTQSGKPVPHQSLSEGRVIEHYAFIPHLVTAYTPEEVSSLWLGLSLREPARVTCTRARNSLATDSGRDLFELPHGQGGSNCSPLGQVLAEDKEKSGGAGKAAAKEECTRFFVLLDETKERHQLARVLEDDSEQRGMLEDEVVKLVVPSLMRPTQKMREKEFSEDIKMTHEEEYGSTELAKPRNIPWNRVSVTFEP
ncbi:hypothetical protein BJY52DRAFT_1417587 [Lactarius psammicola]|nr:hypothetical protein BJY52DRAFT_1417587 [Lactarius psammicola]